MILNIVCEDKYKSWTYAEFVRFTFENKIVQNKLMESETVYNNNIMTFEVLSPEPEFLKLMQTLYPEHLLTQ